MCQSGSRLDCPQVLVNQHMQIMVIRPTPVFLRPEQLIQKPQVETSLLASCSEIYMEMKRRNRSWGNASPSDLPSLCCSRQMSYFAVREISVLKEYRGSVLHAKDIHIVVLFVLLSVMKMQFTQGCLLSCSLYLVFKSVINHTLQCIHNQCEI